jgi:N6-L-threonylcarbamoyladenine synthase
MTASSPLVRTATDKPCSANCIQNLPLPPTITIDAAGDDDAPKHYKPNANGDTIVLGIEGSANKVGVGVLKYSPPGKNNGNDDDDDGDGGTYHILANPRKTYIAPTGEGTIIFVPAFSFEFGTTFLLTIALHAPYLLY